MAVFAECEQHGPQSKAASWCFFVEQRPLEITIPGPRRPWNGFQAPPRRALPVCPLELRASRRTLWARLVRGVHRCASRHHKDIGAHIRKPGPSNQYRCYESHFYQCGGPKSCRTVSFGVEATLGWSWPNLGRVWPHVAQLRPRLVELSQRFAEFGSMLAIFDQRWSNLAKCRSSLANAGQNLGLRDKCSSNFAKCWSEVAKPWPTAGICSQLNPGSRQLTDNSWVPHGSKRIGLRSQFGMNS